MDTHLTPYTRIVFVDYVKAIAILLVVAYHCEFNSSLPLLQPVLSMCVPLFFMSTGFLWSQRKTTQNTTIVHLKKIVLLFFVWAVISCITKSISTEERISVGTVYSHFISGDVGYYHHLWYLKVFFVATLFRLLVQISERNILIAILLLSAISSIDVVREFL